VKPIAAEGAEATFPHISVKAHTAAGPTRAPTESQACATAVIAARPARYILVRYGCDLKGGRRQGWRGRLRGHVVQAGAACAVAPELARQVCARERDIAVASVAEAAGLAAHTLQPSAVCHHRRDGLVGNLQRILRGQRLCWRGGGRSWRRWWHRGARVVIGHEDGAQAREQM